MRCGEVVCDFCLLRKLMKEREMDKGRVDSRRPCASNGILFQLRYEKYGSLYILSCIFVSNLR